MTSVTGFLRKTCKTGLFYSFQNQKASYTLVARVQERPTFFSLLTACALNATRKTLPSSAPWENAFMCCSLKNQNFGHHGPQDEAF